MMISWKKKPIAKAHVKQYERASPTGQLMVVHEHERVDPPGLHIKDILDATIRQPSSAYPKANPAAVETQQQYQLPNGMYSRDRQALHNAIIRKEFLGKTPAEQATVYFMGGGPASGKGHLLSTKVVDVGDQAVMVNPDHIKAQLPEYREKVAAKDATASFAVHEESSDISKEMMQYAGAHGYDCVVDTVGDSGIEKLARKIADLRANGQRIVGHYVTVPVPIALARAELRGHKTGRFVDEAVLRDLHAQVSRVWPELVRRGIFDHVTLWNTVAEPPTKIAEAEGSVLTIHDPGAYERFLAKGHPNDERGDHPDSEGSGAGPASVDRHAGSAGVPGEGPGGEAAEPDLRAAERAVAFKTWFKDSKVVNADGTPMVVYHGTKSDFNTFDLSKVGNNNDTGMWGTGFYFSPIKKMSAGYGHKFKRVYLSLQNPLVLHAINENWPDIVNGPYVPHSTHGEEGKQYSDAMRQKLIAAGYDGVIQYERHFTRRMVMPSEKISQVVAFYPEQIKSATSNRGTFDQADPDITKSHIKQHERLNPSGSVSEVREHDDKRTKKPDEPAQPRKPTEPELSAREGLAALLKDISKPDGGFTYSPVSDDSPMKGYALSVHKDRERIAPASAVTPGAIFHYTDDNWDLIKEEGNFIGAWHNPEDDQVYLDVSTVVDSKEDAERLGRENGQLAYFDLQTFQSVPIAPKGAGHEGQTQVLPRGEQDGSTDAGTDSRPVHKAHREGSDAGGEGRSRSLVREEDRGRLSKSHPIHYHATFGPLDISIENRTGSIRRWTDPYTGEEGETKFEHPYGYIRLTHSPFDHEHVDVFIGPNVDATTAYIVTQMKTPEFKEVDEQKCMLGFNSAEEAKSAYLRHYTDPRFFGSMMAMPMDEFTRKVLATKDEPSILKSQQLFSEAIA